MVPPTRDLPPPQSDDAARRNAAWPQDQDEKRRREAKRKKDTRVFSWEDLSRQLSPGELRNGTASSPKDAALRKRSADNVEDADRQYKPSELGYAGGLFGDFKSFFTGNNKDETATFDAEPPRASLTDPPTGYRSPSPLEPYGLRGDHAKAKPMTQEDRVNQGLDK